MRFLLSEDVSLSEAFMIFRATYEKGKFLAPDQVSIVIRVIENPSYSVRIFGREVFPGRTTLERHDYLHSLLGVRGTPDGEAFVLGATMGSTGKMNAIRAFLFLWLENIFAPRQFHYDANARRIFYLTVRESTRLAKEGVLKDISTFSIESHLSESVGSIRKTLGIDALIESLRSEYR